MGKIEDYFFGKTTDTVNKLDPYSDYQRQGMQDLYNKTNSQGERTAADYNKSEMGNNFENIMQAARQNAQSSYGQNAQAIAQKYKQAGSYGMGANYQNSNQLAQDLYNAEANNRMQKAQYMDQYNRQGQQLSDAYNANRANSMAQMLSAQPYEMQIDQKKKPGFFDWLKPVAEIGATVGKVATGL